MDNHKEFIKWKIPIDTLKRLDQIQSNWKPKPPKLLSIPLLFLSTKLTSSDLKLTTWDFKQKSTSFPLLPTTDTKRKSFEDTNNAKRHHRPQFDSSVLGRFSFLTTHKHADTLLSLDDHLQKNKYLDHLYGKLISSNITLHQPQHNLKNFQQIKNKASNKHQRKICELDNPRFNFD